MPNVLDANGLQIETFNEALQRLTSDLQLIYGPDIDLSSNSPDGQAIRLFLQSVQDLKDKLVDIYTTFDPDEAFGKTLQLRVGINGIQVQGGTFSFTPVEIVTSRAVNYYGLDQTAQPVYTVRDAAGNKWLLVATQTVSGAGTYSFSFRAEKPGRVTTVQNTINIPVTIVLGTVSVNNPALQSVIGQDEETDAALKLRRQISVAMPSQGFIDALRATLANVSGVSSAKVLENVKDLVDADGVPAHGIWVIVSGDAAPADIAQAIYVQRSQGANMRGAQVYLVVTPESGTFAIYWDNVEPQDLFIKFTVTPIDGTHFVRVDQILQQLPGLMVPAVGGEVNITQLGTFVQQVDPNALVTLAGFRSPNSGPYFNVLNPSAKNKQFIVTEQNIYILPILLLPRDAVVAQLESKQFAAYGGSQTGFAYSISVNNSGGSINSVSGLYTAGGSSGIDTIRVTDSDANFSEVDIEVL